MAEKYIPNSEIDKQLTGLTYLALIGISGSGKDTLMNTAADITGGQMHRVISYTNRIKRDTETDGVDYHFVADSSSNMQALDRQVVEGSLVQHAVHPTLGTRYWTTIEEWAKTDYPMLDTLTKAYDDLRPRPFLGRYAIAVVCTPEERLGRIGQRDAGMNQGEIQRRNKEGLMSLSWCLENKETIWVHNQDDQQVEAARAIVNIATKKPYMKSDQARKVGERLFDYLRRAT